MIPDAVRAYARRMASWEHTYEDLEQDAVLAIIRAGGERKNEAERVVIGLNAIRDTMRKLRYRRQVGALPEHYDARSHEVPALLAIIGRETRQRVLDGVSSRAALVLHSLERGETKSEAARSLRISAASVSRAVAELKERCEALGVA